MAGLERGMSANKRSFTKGKLAARAANRITNPLDRETYTSCYDVSGLTIAVPQASISGPGSTPSTRTAIPFKLNVTRMSLVT